MASARPGRTAETCAYPIRVLPPGGVLVRWNANALPNWWMPKATSTVAGRGAVESKALGGWCAVLGGTETITVMIPRRARQVVSDRRLPAQPGPVPTGSADIVYARLGADQSRRLRPVQATAGRGAMSPAALPTMYLAYVRSRIWTRPAMT